MPRPVLDRSFQFPPQVRVEGEGVLRYQDDGQLTGLANGARLALVRRV